jgi:hypothetical protein
LNRQGAKTPRKTIFKNLAALRLGGSQKKQRPFPDAVVIL